MSNCRLYFRGDGVEEAVHSPRRSEDKLGSGVQPPKGVAIDTATCKNQCYGHRELTFPTGVLNLLRDGIARSKGVVVEAIVHSLWVLSRIFLASSYELDTVRFKYMVIDLVSNFRWEPLEWRGYLRYCFPFSRTGRLTFDIEIWSCRHCSKMSRILGSSIGWKSLPGSAASVVGTTTAGSSVTVVCSP